MAEETAEAPPAAPAKAASAWPPLIAVIVLMPVISFASVQYLVLPKLKAAVLESSPNGETKPAAPAKTAPAKPAAAKSEKGHGKAGKDGPDANGRYAYDFDNIVVNLSGAMGTRYLKTSFTIFSTNAELKSIIDENKKQLLDVGITVLSARSMADLENGGAKNVVRNELQATFNQALNSDLVEQIYFSEFVVQ